MPLKLEEAEKVLDAALAKAREQGTKIAAIVVDEAGLPIAGRRMEGTLPWAWQVAEAKAVGCALWQRDGDYIAQVAHERAIDFQQLNLLPILRGLPMIPAKGGLLIRRGDRVVGVVACSGGSADGDKLCSQAGIDALGFGPSAKA